MDVLRNEQNKIMNCVYIGYFALPDKNAAAHRVIANAKLLNTLGYCTTFIGRQTNNDWGDTCSLYYGFSYIETNALNGIGAVCCKKREILEGYLEMIGKIDLIIVYDLQVNLYLWAMKYAKKHSIKLVADTTEWYNTGGYGTRTIPKMIDTAFRMKVLNKRADGIIVISKYLRDYYRNCHTILLPPLIDCMDDKWPSSSEWTADKKKIRFVYCGEMGKTKDSPWEIIQKMDSTINGRTVHFDFVGITEDGFRRLYKNADSLLDKYNGNIVFHGRLSHRECLHMIARCDISLIIRKRSRKNQAGFPTKLVESISCGTPVIANDFSNICDYLDGANGAILDVAEDISSQVLALHTDLINDGKVNVNKRAFDYRLYTDEMRSFLKIINEHNSSQIEKM